MQSGIHRVAAWGTFSEAGSGLSREMEEKASPHSRKNALPQKWLGLGLGFGFAFGLGLGLGL